MFRRNKVYFISIAVLLVILLSFLVYYLINNQASEKNSLQYPTSFLDDESVVYLGNDEVENEIVFIFDYSCMWCSHWMDEVFPTINKLIDEEIVKFRTQSMVFLSDASLQLSKIDQHIKEYYPDKYFEIYTKIIADGDDGDYEQLLAHGYIEEVIADFQLDDNLLLSETSIDVIFLTRKYTNELHIESVPTLIVNGIKLADPFSIEEIEKLLN